MDELTNENATDQQKLRVALISANLGGLNPQVAKRVVLEITRGLSNTGYSKSISSQFLRSMIVALHRVVQRIPPRDAVEVCSQAANQLTKSIDKNFPELFWSIFRLVCPFWPNECLPKRRSECAPKPRST